MTPLYPPGRFSLEIKQEDVAAPDPGAHARLTTVPLSPRVLANELQAIYAQLRTIAATVDAITPRVREAVNAIMGDECGDIRMSDILQITAAHFEVTPREIRSGRRSVRLVRPRQVVMYLCKTMTPRSYPEIAMFLGGRDHTTVMHGVKVISRTMEHDSDFAKEVGVLTDKILGG
jgi:chromosomal replication initiation ATPase DnaA